MTTAADLLPPNATPAERAIAASLHAPLPVPIRQVMSPAQTPVPFLPFLAAHRGVDLWYEDWSESRKRQMVAQAPFLARLIGMREAARQLLPFVDAALVAATAYPDAYAVEAMAVDEQPIEPPPFLATYLVKIATLTPAGAYVPDTEPVEASFVGSPDAQPMMRALAALRVAQAPHDETHVDFQNYRPMTAGDAISAGAGLAAGHQITVTRIGAAS